MPHPLAPVGQGAAHEVPGPVTALLLRSALAVALGLHLPRLPVPGRLVAAWLLVAARLLVTLPLALPVLLRQIPTSVVT